MQLIFGAFIHKTSEMLKFKCSQNCMPLKSIDAQVAGQAHWLSL